MAGTALVSLASTAGATAAFLVSRYLARPFVEKRLEGEGGGGGEGVGGGCSARAYEDMAV